MLTHHCVVASAAELSQNNKSVEAEAMVARMKSDEVAAIQARTLADREHALALMADKCARMEDEIALLPVSYPAAVDVLCLFSPPGHLELRCKYVLYCIVHRIQWWRWR